MNPHLKAALDKFESLKAEGQAIRSKTDITDTDRERMKVLPAEMDAARKAVEDAKSFDDSVKAAEGFSDRPEFQSVGAGAKSFANEPHESDKEILERLKSLGSSMHFIERAGYEAFGFSKSGKAISIESGGWGMSEQTFKAISEPTYVKAWEEMIRRQGKNMPEVTMKALLPGLDADGGWLAPPEYVTELIRRDPYPTEILSRIRQVPCSRDKVIWPRETAPDSDTADIYASPVRMKFGTDQGSSPEIDPTFGNAEIPINTAIFPVKVNRNLLEDSAIPISAIIMEDAQEAYDLGLDNYIMTGTGNTQPMGLLTNAGGTGFTLPTHNVGNPAIADGLSDLILTLPPQYRRNFIDTCFVTSALNDASFSKLKDQSGQYIYGLMRDNGPGGMADMRLRRIFGFDVVYSAFMPALGAGNAIAAFGNFRKAYIYCQRMGLTVFPVGDQDYSLVTANQVAFVFKIRGGGEIVQNRAAQVGIQS